jgi:hypothetical protein
MLEYLLLRDNDIASQWRPQLEVHCHDTLTLNERELLQQSPHWSSMYHALPAFCITLRNLSPQSSFRLLLGVDGLEYQHYEYHNTVMPRGLWPQDLTPYERE